MKLSLAPIQGMTNAFYRNYYADFFGGFDSYYSPFINTLAIDKCSDALFKDLTPENNTGNLTVIPQLLSNNPINFKHYADIICELGYKEINWNIGCPYPMVTKKKKGSGILTHPELVEAMLDEICKNDHYEVSVKMRLGMHDTSEGEKIVQLLNGYPIKNVIIHGRTGDQKYKGTVDLDAFETLYNACQHKVIYNGDIFTFADYEHISERFPKIDEFMLGRGALQDPFLARQILQGGQVTTNKIEVIRQFHEAVLGHYLATLSGDKHLCDKMK